MLFTGISECVFFNDAFAILYKVNLISAFPCAVCGGGTFWEKISWGEQCEREKKGNLFVVAWSGGTHGLEAVVHQVLVLQA